jgi:hypothetical protein
LEIAELFVSLGIKGSDKTIGAITQVKTGLSDVASTSLEAKAAIIGAMYALEQLMSQSATRGTELSNFNALTGISVKQLQQWQYAARQASESNEQFAGTIKGIQEKMADMKLNAGQPDKLPLLASAVGFDVKKAFDEKTGAFYVLKKAQELVDTNVPVDVQNRILKSLNIDEATITSLRKHVFTQKNFDKAPIYSDKEVDQLAKVNVLWGNLNNKIQMLFGHFTAAHGAQLVGDISKVADQVFRMITAFEKLSEKLHLFQAVGNAFSGWAIIFSKISTSIDQFSPKISAFFDTLESKLLKIENKFHVIEKIAQVFQEAFKGWGTVFSKLSDLIDKFTGSETPQNSNQQNNDNKVLDNAVKQINNTDYVKEIGKSVLDFITGKSLFDENQKNKNKSLNINSNILPKNENVIVPKVQPVQPTNSSTQNTTIHQNLNFNHEGKDHQQTKDSVHKAVNEAWKQSYALSQGS